MSLINAVYGFIVSDNNLDMENEKTNTRESSDLVWVWRDFGEMNPELLYDLLAFRESIFVVEQNCIYQELDGLDKTAMHLMALDAGNVVACLRILPPVAHDAPVRIGRVAVSKEWRNRGVAILMMQKAIDKARSDYPSSGVFLNAQTYLQGFYESLNFQICGDEFLEDGIPHIPMRM